jgi:hypothetical protein
MNALVVMEIYHLLQIRNIHSRRFIWQQPRGTRVLWVAIGRVVAGQFAITHLPLLGGFETESAAGRTADPAGEDDAVCDHRGGEAPASGGGHRSNASPRPRPCAKGRGRAGLNRT